jgi:hypothetical protein
MEDRFNLTDNAISHIAQLVQVAILTGTDIIDHMRMIELRTDENNSLLLDKDYETRFNSSIKDMLSNVQRQSGEEQASE